MADKKKQKKAALSKEGLEALRKLGKKGKGKKKSEPKKDK